MFRTKVKVVTLMCSHLTSTTAGSRLILPLSSDFGLPSTPSIPFFPTAFCAWTGTSLAGSRQFYHLLDVFHSF